jgi:hypothetical protein
MATMTTRFLLQIAVLLTVAAGCGSKSGETKDAGTDGAPADSGQIPSDASADVAPADSGQTPDDAGRDGSSAETGGCDRQACEAHAGYNCWASDGDASASEACCRRGDAGALECLP